MGLREKYAKKLEMQGFEPIDLNEEDVRVIFKKCLATKNSQRYVKSILQPASYGNDKDSDPLIFDAEKLQSNKKEIYYLYGQLLVVHEDINTVNVVKDTRLNSMTNYKNEIWTTNKGILMQFFHLGVAPKIIYPFGPTQASMFHFCVYPTLSPNDPNFPEWWAKHKSEWEGKRHGGVEFDSDV